MKNKLTELRGEYKALTISRRPHALPELQADALPVLFFLLLPPELDCLSRLSFAAQQATLPRPYTKWTLDYEKEWHDLKKLLMPDGKSGMIWLTLIVKYYTS